MKNSVRAMFNLTWTLHKCIHINQSIMLFYHMHNFWCVTHPLKLNLTCSNNFVWVLKRWLSSWVHWRLAHDLGVIPSTNTMAHKCVQLQLQRIQHPLLVSAGIAFIYIYRFTHWYTHTYTNKHIIEITHVLSLLI